MRWLRSTIGVGEARERAQVGQALAALGPPGPFPADRRGEAELEGRVEVLVGVAEHAAEQPVDVGGADRAQRQPSGQVDVAHRVEGEADPVHAPVAFQQEAVEGRVVLVRLAAEEGLHAQAVRADHQPGHGGELVLARKPDQVGAGPRALIPDLELRQRRLDTGGGVGRGTVQILAHARTGAAADVTEPVYTLMASEYTSTSRSAVAGQPNADACSSAPRDSEASRAGDASNSASTLA